MMSCIILLKTKTIPKTTSGKIARSWCRKAYIDGSLSILVKWDSDTKNIENGNENENGNRKRVNEMKINKANIKISIESLAINP